jgi:hypothetical protein
MLNFVLPKRRNLINNNPRQTPSEIHSFVHHKGHDARSEHVVLHVDVPRSPHLLEVVERDIVFGDFLELRPVCVLGEAEGKIA